MTVALMHPRFVTANRQFFLSAATIEEKTATLDDYGQEVETWAPVAGLMSLACSKAPLSAMERQAANFTATDQGWHVLLAGAFPTITTTHRAVIDGTVYDIDASETDQTGSLTRLRVRQVAI